MLYFAYSSLTAWWQIWVESNSGVETMVLWEQAFGLTTLLEGQAWPQVRIPHGTPLGHVTILISAGISPVNLHSTSWLGNIMKLKQHKFCIHGKSFKWAVDMFNNDRCMINNDMFSMEILSTSNPKPSVSFPSWGREYAWISIFSIIAHYNENPNEGKPADWDYRYLSKPIKEPLVKFTSRQSTSTPQVTKWSIKEL